MSAARDFWAPLAGDPRLRWGVRPADGALQGLAPVYLATPYSRRAIGPDGLFDLMRAQDACADALRVLRILTLADVPAFAPIVQSHAVICDLLASASCDAGAAQVAGFALDGAFWERLNRPHVMACRSLYVPDIAGWQDSVGIRAEVAAMLARNRPVLIQAPAFDLVGGAGDCVDGRMQGL